LSQDSLKKYEYVLPYIVYPDKQEDDADLETTVNVVAEVPERNQPLVFEYDWELDELDEFVAEKLKEEDLPESAAESLKESIRSEVSNAKKKKREEKERKKSLLDNLSEEEKESLKSQRVIKFYPQGEDPDIRQCKTSFINRYYGHAQEVR
jgi:FKBP-type peptidyl-prolyl cis-trans isomerase